MHHILIVDDDTVLSKLLADYLTNDGYKVSTADSGQQALDAPLDQINLMVLDIMMPGLSGLDVLKQLRTDNQLPVLMLTGRGDDLDRIIGLELGADDYLPKPCNPRELSARISAILRRTTIATPTDTANNDRLAQAAQHADIVINQTLLKASFNEHDLALTQAEFLLLMQLLDSGEAPISKSELTQAVLNRPLEQHDRAIDVHVSRLRNKLAQANCPLNILAIRGRGYRLTNHD